MRRGLFSCLVLVAVCSTAAANSSPAAPAPAFAVTFVLFWYAILYYLYKRNIVFKV